jgi:hypothetical protein
MLDLIVFIKHSGINVREDNFRDTIHSFVEKNKDQDFKFYIVTDPALESSVLGTIKSLRLDTAILDLKTTQNSWAYDFNVFLDAHKNDSKWLLISHDDVVFETDNYFSKIKERVGDSIESIGWITSTSEYYYKHEGKLVTDTFRPGFHLDHHMWGKGMWQLSSGELTKIQYPPSPVKIHGPMSAIMLITMDSMKKIGYCEDWTRYTMLIDEDWSLTSLKNNLWNIWVPDVHHLHPNRRHLRKANNRWEKEAHAGIEKKWGFDIGNSVVNGWKQGISIPIEHLRQRYAGTNIPWSSYRNSYDWDFL